AMLVQPLPCITSRNMAKSNRNFEPAIVLTLAILFVGYHIFATVFGMISFAQVLLGQETQAQVESTSAGAGSQSITKVEVSKDIVLGNTVDIAHWPKRIVITPADLNTAIYGLKEDQSRVVTSDSLVAYDPNSALPNGKAGNSVFYGKDASVPFERLHDLKVGDEILIALPTASYTYKVVGTKNLPSLELSAFTQTNYPSLTLIAVSPDKDEHFAIVANYSRKNK